MSEFSIFNGNMAVVIALRKRKVISLDSAVVARHEHDSKWDYYSTILAILSLTPIKGKGRSNEINRKFIK